MLYPQRRKLYKKIQKTKFYKKIQPHIFTAAMVSPMLLIGIPALIQLIPPGGEIIESSKTKMCEQGINDTLIAFSEEMGYGYDVYTDDHLSIFNTGKISKEYFHNGIHYTLHFALEPKGSICKLLLHKINRQGGGDNLTSVNGSTATISNCSCE